MAVCEYLRQSGAFSREQDNTKNFTEQATFRFRKKLIQLLQQQKREEELIFAFPLTAKKAALNKPKDKGKKKEKKPLSFSGIYVPFFLFFFIFIFCVLRIY